LSERATFRGRTVTGSGPAKGTESRRHHQPQADRANPKVSRGAQGRYPEARSCLCLAVCSHRYRNPWARCPGQIQMRSHPRKWCPYVRLVCVFLHDGRFATLPLCHVPSQRLLPQGFAWGGLGLASVPSVHGLQLCGLTGRTELLKQVCVFVAGTPPGVHPIIGARECAVRAGAQWGLLRRHTPGDQRQPSRKRHTPRVCAEPKAECPRQGSVCDLGCDTLFCAAPWARLISAPSACIGPLPHLGVAWRSCGFPLGFSSHVGCIPAFACFVGCCLILALGACFCFIIVGGPPGVGPMLTSRRFATPGCLLFWEASPRPTGVSYIPSSSCVIAYLVLSH